MNDLISNPVATALRAAHVVTVQMRIAAADEIDRLTKREAELVKALEAAVNSDGGTSYDSNEDEVGVRACCHDLSYRPHSNDCWVPLARAALKEST